MPYTDAFIFDMDGTLIDNMRFHSKVWLDLLAEADHPITEEEFFQNASGKTNREILQQYLGPLSEEEIAAYAHRKEVLYREVYRPHLKPIAGLLPFLEKAKAAGIGLAVATSAGRDNIDFTLDGLNLNAYFATVTRGDEVTHGKPDPEIFLLAAQRLGVNPARCIVFEDAFAGIEGARRAGMQAVVLATTLAAESLEGLPHVLHIVPDYATLEPADLLRETGNL